MKFIKPFLLFSFLLPLTIHAQITVVDITTDSVSVFNNTEQSTKSANLAMIASGIFPGLGQQYLGKNRSALALFSIDIMSLFGAIFLEKYSRQLEIDAHGYATLHAAIDSRNKDERFWNAVGSFSNIKEYHETLKLDRQQDQMYTNESNYWYWEDDEYQEKYNDFRDNSRKIHTVASICIGAMIINRIIAIVDIKASTRYKAENAFSSLRLQPTISSDFSSAGITLKTGF